MLLGRETITNGDRTIWRLAWLGLALPFLGLTGLVAIEVVVGDAHPGVLAVAAVFLLIAAYPLWKATQEPSKPILPRGGEGWMAFLIGAVVEIGIVIGLSATAHYSWPFW